VGGCCGARGKLSNLSEKNGVQGLVGQGRRGALRFAGKGVDPNAIKEALILNLDVSLSRSAPQSIRIRGIEILNIIHKVAFHCLLCVTTVVALIPQSNQYIAQFGTGSTPSDLAIDFSLTALPSHCKSFPYLFPLRHHFRPP